MRYVIPTVRVGAHCARKCYRQGRQHRHASLLHFSSHIRGLYSREEKSIVNVYNNSTYDITGFGPLTTASDDNSTRKLGHALVSLSGSRLGGTHLESHEEARTHASRKTQQPRKGENYEPVPERNPQKMQVV